MLLLLVALSTPIALAEDVSATGQSSLQTEIDQLRSEISEYRAEMHEIDLNKERINTIREIVLDVLSDAETRTSLQQAEPSGTLGRADAPAEPPSDWNELRTADGNFSMVVNYYMQVDWIFNKTASENTKYGFENQRNRVTFSGNIINKHVNYYLRLEFGDDGVGNPEAAFMQFNFCENWALQAGLVYSMFSLEENISNDQELGVNLSFVAGQFDQETERGLVLGWQSEKTRFWLTYGNGFAQTNVAPLYNTRQGVMCRFGYKPFGNWENLYNFNPHPNTTEPGVLLGFAGAFDWGTYNDPNSSIVTGPAVRATADVTWQMPGFSIMNAAYFQDWSQGGTLGGTRWAAVSQVTGFVTPEWQLYGRYEWGRIMDSAESDVSMATVGMSYYPFQTEVLKLSLELLYSFGATVNWKIDGDPGIRQTTNQQTIIRSQLQISF